MVVVSGLVGGALVVAAGTEAKLLEAKLLEAQGEIYYLQGEIYYLKRLCWICWTLRLAPRTLLYLSIGLELCQQFFPTFSES